MQETLQAIKDVWMALDGFGWKPMPIVASIVAMVAARSYFEPDILQVNTVEALKRMGRIKLLISISVFATCFMLQVGLARPAIGFDWILSTGFAAVDVCAGYVISSSAIVRNFIKNSIFKGGSNAPTNPPSV